MKFLLLHFITHNTVESLRVFSLSRYCQNKYKILYKFIDNYCTIIVIIVITISYQEPCVWKCKHFKCTKVCSDDCDRPPCYTPCPKKLKCKHKCIGFCGETCPPLCRICDEAEVTNIVFGYEDEPDARHVQLHIIIH